MAHSQVDTQCKRHSPERKTILSDSDRSPIHGLLGMGVYIDKNLTNKSKMQNEMYFGHFLTNVPDQFFNFILYKR